MIMQAFAARLAVTLFVLAFVLQCKSFAKGILGSGVLVRPVWQSVFVRAF